MTLCRKRSDAKELPGDKAKLAGECLMTSLGGEVAGMPGEGMMRLPTPTEPF
jgi:hypothetical protein